MSTREVLDFFVASSFGNNTVRCSDAGFAISMTWMT